MHYLRYLRRQFTMVRNLQVQRTTNTHPLEPTQLTLPTLPRLQKLLGETTVCLEPTVPKPDNNIILSVALATTTARRIYRIHPHSDVFGCEYCRRKGDKGDMQGHQCRGSKK